MSRSGDESFLSEGFTLGTRFRLERLLGRGASGSVWQATHLALSAPVAIKFLDQIAKHLHAEEEVEGYVDRFRFEAQVSARLSTQTRHTVSVQDAGVFRGVPFLVMEYAPGHSLEQIIERDGTVPIAELVKVADHIGEALAAAHALGIVHRDVKTPNILCVEREGQESLYKLADFGVARMSGAHPLDLAAPKKTGEGMIVGTPAYMSPEQIGAEATCGPPTDLWALGVVLYEGMTGRMPFNGVSLTELAMSISASPYAPPSETHPFSPAVDAFFHRALAKRPIDRFDSATEMARAFRAAVLGTVEPDSVEIPGVQGKRTTLLVVAACVLALVIGGVTWLTHTPPASSAEAQGASSAAKVDDFAGLANPGPEIYPRTVPASALPPATASTTQEVKHVVASPHVTAASPVKSAAPEPHPSAPPPVVETAKPIPTIDRPPVNPSEVQ